jgi:hypothetical protein
VEKKVYADSKGKVMQIYWVESAYFFYLSAAADQVNSADRSA